MLKSIAQALNLSAEALFAQAGLMPESTHPNDNATETALRKDPRLTEPQKRALLAVYRSLSDRTVLGRRTMRRISDFVK